MICYIDGTLLLIYRYESWLPSNEATVYMSGEPSQPNACILGLKNPNVYRELLRGSPTDKVWCGVINDHLSSLRPAIIGDVIL